MNVDDLKIGSLVRHIKDGDIGVVTHLTENRVIFVCPDRRFWKTYRHKVEVLCK